MCDGLSFLKPSLCLGFLAISQFTGHHAMLSAKVKVDMMTTQKSKPLCPHQTLDDLNTLYTMALAQENLALAVKIKELQARILGLLQPQDKGDFLTLSDVTLKKLIQQLEQEIKS